MESYQPLSKIECQLMHWAFSSTAAEHEACRLHGDWRADDATVALSWSAACGRLDMVDCFSKTGTAKALGSDGMSALMRDAHAGDAREVESLSKVSDLDQIGICGTNALMRTALSNSPKCVEALVDAGADVDLVDPRKKTASRLAFDLGHAQCVKAIRRAQMKPAVLEHFTSLAKNFRDKLVRGGLGPDSRRVGRLGK